MRRFVALLAAGLLGVAGCATTPDAPPGQPTNRQVGVQLFQWTWNSVARECTDVLGPQQFDFVLLSPAQEHIQGDPWWTSYQPVSYRIESKLGTRDEFAAMVQACHDAGVKVVADAVINHMAGIAGGTGFAGTEFTHQDYPGLYDAADFHTCATASGNIENYRDRQQVQECQLSGLADLRTGDPGVRATITAYLEDLRSLGVDGFRIDAAKHMPADDVEAIVSAVAGDPLVISEVIRAPGEPVQPEDYLGSGGVFTFAFAKDIAGVIPGGALHRALNLRDGSVPSDKAFTFVTNHDTERNGQTATYKDAARFRLAGILMLAVPYGTPVLYSGYAFSERDTGAPQSGGAVDDVSCATPDAAGTFPEGAWVCAHRDLAPLAGWVAVVGDAEPANVWQRPDAVAFDRGSLGLIAINGHATEGYTQELTTGLPDGTYCDALTACETKVAVQGGKATVTVPPSSAVALDVNHRAPNGRA